MSDAEQERAAIVAYLRGRRFVVDGEITTINDIWADDIERGEHLKGDSDE